MKEHTQILISVTYFPKAKKKNKLESVFPTVSIQIPHVKQFVAC